MSSLSDPKVSSVTYSGDLMQRMTNNGLRDWKDLKLFQKDFEHRELEISYRQSHPLLELAKAIYRKALSKEPTYQSYLVDTNEDPSPLLCNETDQEGRIAWIAKRIKEIHKAYGDNIPSIAIFLPNDEGMEKFAKKLGDYELLSDVGIRVKACRDGEVLGSKNTVRVFSVEHIKGLEFEAVFFHNFDQLLENTSPDMLLKVLYVGLSRATFYLALTTDSVLPSELSFLNDHFKSGNFNWEIK